MTHEEHIERHKILHRELDELISDCIMQKKEFFPSKSTVMELMQWSHEQTLDSRKENHD